MSNVAIEKIPLPNGIRLVVDKEGNPDTVSVMVLVKAGSRYADEKTMGLAHFYEHLVVMGTECFPSNLEFTVKLEEVGADFNAFTAEEYTAFYVKTEVRHLELAVKMLSELIVRPLLKQSEIDRERLVIMEEINMREDTPQIKVVDRMMELLFAGSGLGLPAIGTKETVAQFRREAFVGFQKRYYHGSHLVVAVSGGGVVEESIRPLVEDYFGQLAIGDIDLPEDAHFKPTNTKVELIHKPTDQLHLALGFLGVSRKDERRYVQSLLAVILGSGFSSRLFQKVRQDRSLAYSVGTDTELYADTGAVMIEAGVDKQRAEEAVQVIWEELRKVQGGADQVTEEELLKAKNYVRGKMALRWEDSMNRAMFYGVQALLDPEILSPEQVIEKLELVTIADVSHLAQQLFKPERLAMVAVGNNTLDKEKFSELIKKS